MDSETNRRLQDLIDASPLSCIDRETCYSICQPILSFPNGTRRRKALVSLFESTALSNEQSCVPLACLSFILKIIPDSWLPFDLTRCYSRLWRALPESIKSGNDSQLSTLVDESLKLVKNSYQNLLELLHSDSDKPAISETQHHKNLSHRALSTFIDNFRIPVPTYNGTKATVVIALPNGHLMALACLAVATYYTAAPINSTNGAEQFRNDVLHTNSKTILVRRLDLERLELYDSWIAEASIEVFVVDGRPDMTFDLSPLNKPSQLVDYPSVPNSPDDLAFVLYTSGTSGNKKVVPLSLHNLVSGVAFVIESWNLTEDDVCLNMMPLNHV